MVVKAPLCIMLLYTYLYVCIHNHTYFFNFYFYYMFIYICHLEEEEEKALAKVTFFLYHINKQLLIPTPCNPLQHNTSISSSKPLSLTAHIFINYNLEEMESFFEVTDKQQDIMNMYCMSEKIN